MATNSKLPFRGAHRRAALVLASLVGAVLSFTLLGAGLEASYGSQGTVARVQATQRPTVQAAFPRQSYRPGETARLVLFDRTPRVTVQVFRAGTERSRISARDLMLGTVVSAPTRVSAGARSASIRIGAWPSGLYFARLHTADGRVGFAPFVLRPSRLGEHKVAIVLPTLTWQAYNFRDDDADGDADSWYAQGSVARLGRPFENRGVPPHYKYYDQPFLRWLVSTNHNVDYLAQSDLESATGSTLASSYSLIVFPGHHEYVTDREYVAVETYRNRGGNLMFLSANNFFYKVVENGALMRRVGKWRDLGRPEAALIGVQYIGNDDGEHRGPWIVRPAGAGHWIFAGTGARPGSSFSNAGIEIDRTAPSSPRGTKVLAEIPNLLGPGMTAEMTYYETNSGAKVFAAGAFSLAGSIRQPPVARLISNLWDRLGGDRTLQTGGRVLASARGYGWPVKPFDRQHPVRGFFGDPRIGGAHGSSKQFHFGVDVSAPNGTPVFATISGTVSFIHADALSVAAGGGLAFEYWHIVPTVRAGERVKAYETVIGHVEKPWAHVHFSERRNGVYVNPLRAGAMRPFVDDAEPRVRAIDLRGGELTADVEDETPIAVPAPWSSLPVMPSIVRWRIAGERWQTVVDFRTTIPSASAFHAIYAHVTRQNHANLPGLYRIRLASGSVATRARGRNVQVEVFDAGGNRASASRSLR